MTSKHYQAPSLISQKTFDGIKSFREFEQRVSNLFETNTKAQGDAFEIFVEAYLATQPILQCQETYLVGDIPVDIRETLNLPNDSKGIDGVYKSMLGDYVPYQVKFRSNRPALGFNEVAPFLGITEKATDRLLITNCDTIAIDVQNRTGIRSLRGVDFDQLTEEDFTVIENWLKQKPEKRKLLTPDPYQYEALDDIANHFNTNDRGTVVMACGTGKTLVALWAVEQSKAKSILVLVPSLTLLQQTLEEWSIHNSWGKDFSYLCVCSDPSVNLKNDEIEIDPTDVPFRIDTDPEIVKKYLAQDNGKIKIVFSTYHSSQVVSQATRGEFGFDVAIFDEAHKTTGSASGRFAVGLNDENITIKKRLFLTATPKHYDISKRDKDGEFKFVSMDDEAVYGKRAHTLTFGDAAAKGIICPYKVVITLIDKQQVDDFALKNGITLVEGDSVKAKWVASQIAVSSAIKHTNAKKIITFHSRVKTAREFASDEVYGIKKFVDDFEVFHVHGKQRSNDRKDTISKFKKSSRSIITNAKCLTEGVDVPAVDMVAFVDPRHSKIDIAQAVGRAMRKPRGGDKKIGYIVVPIFAEDTREQSLEKAIKSEDFDDVALILNSLLEQDEELVEIVRELKKAKGSGAVFNPKRIKEKVEVIGPFIGLDELTNSIYVEAIDRLGESWDEWYGRLLAYTSHYGTSQVPVFFVDENGNRLGSWVSTQRLNKSLLVERKDKLEQLLNWSWDPINEAWELGFANLKNYITDQGHSDVPQKYITEKGFKLGQWVTIQRSKRDQMQVERRIRLSNLDLWNWDPKNENWEKGYQCLLEYSNSTGNCYVPINFVTDDGFKLGRWTNNQKNRFSKSEPERQKKLLRLRGWEFDPLEDLWNTGYAHLKEFIDLNDHALVPHEFLAKDGFKLGSWVLRQRQNKNITEERREKLTNLKGWSWDPLKEYWEIGYQHLVEYYEFNNTSKVPQKFISGDGYRLGNWVAFQRQKREKLSSEQKEKLESICDWSWKLRLK
jgi:superfamily II DNA or RNA helicase